VVTILALATGAVYAQHSAMLARYGRVLAMATLVAVVSSLSASAGRFPSTMGLLASGLVPIVICALLLTYPSGRLRDRNDRLLLAVGGGVLFTSSTALVVLGSIRFSNLALAHCAAGCPGVASLTLTGPIANGLQVLAIAAMLCLAWGTVASLRHRARLMSLPLRRALAPVRVAALTYALWLSAWRISAHFAPGVATLLDDGVLFLAVLVPLAVVIGGAWQRLYMGDALAEFVAALGQRPGADPQAVMAVTLRDPTLRLGYRPPGGRTYATIDGHPVDPGRAGPDQAVTWIERGHRRVACVVYDADLVDQESFIRAAGAAALMLQERAQLKADLRAYAAGLAASRNRLLKKADAERQSLERDLHDGVQQDLVALRIKIELAEEAMGDDPARSRQMLNAMAHHMDEVLETLRTLARGIYPALLERQGLDDALRSVARRSPLPISVDARTIGRYRRDIEAAVYFCCLEAMQNATKHAGRGAAISVRLAQEDGHLRFEVRDTGVGFDAGQTNGEHGVLNMRDRIEAVDGTLAIDSWSGGGTIVSGRVPVGADVGPAWPAAA
jgi:signal transduction histidine kinase